MNAWRKGRLKSKLALVNRWLRKVSYVVKTKNGFDICIVNLV